MRKQGSCLEKDIIQGTMPGARMWGRPRAAWMDNVNTWTGLLMEESVRTTEDRDQWRKYVHGIRGRLKNRTSFVRCSLLRPGVQPTLVSEPQRWDLYVGPLRQPRERRGIGRCVRCMCALCRVEEGLSWREQLVGYF